MPHLYESLARANRTAIRWSSWRSLLRMLAPEVGLAIWSRLPRRNLRVTAASLLIRPYFTKLAEGPPDMAARLLFRELSVLHWPLYADIRRLGARFAAIAGCEAVTMRLEHVVDDACCQFHVDAVGLRLLCTYSGPATEWLGKDGRIRHMNETEVAVFKGSKFPVPGPRIRHRSPALRHLPRSQRSRLVLCIDQAG